MIKTIIVEDEPEAAQNLELLLKDTAYDVQVVGTFPTVASALRGIQAHKPDLVFMDVRLGKETCFDLLKQISTPPSFKIIFVTGHDQYAVQAFEWSALHYLLKPVATEKLKEALERFVGQGFNDFGAGLEVLNHNAEALFSEKKLSIVTTEGTYYPKVARMVRIEADGNHSKIYLIDRKIIFTAKPLKHFDELLKEHAFFRCHPSHLINKNYLEKQFKKKKGKDSDPQGSVYWLKLTNGDEVPISESKRKELT